MQLLLALDKASPRTGSHLHGFAERALLTMLRSLLGYMYGKCTVCSNEQRWSEDDTKAVQAFSLAEHCERTFFESSFMTDKTSTFAVYMSLSSSVVADDVKDAFLQKVDVAWKDVPGHARGLYPVRVWRRRRSGPMQVHSHPSAEALLQPRIRSSNMI